MITITILYPNKEGGRFDVDYYIYKHMPMSIAKFGEALKSVNISIGQNAGVPGSQPPYIAVCQMVFDSQEAFEKRFNEISADLIADMPAYTDIEIIFQVSEVAIMRPVAM
ncbi:MAG TPA: EthD family reductase [Chitinophagaceae bacterium]|nr:EthD family reductase [Chitinophagaceae bacterium]